MASWYLFHQSMSFTLFFSLCWSFLTFFLGLDFLFFHRWLFYFRFFNLLFLLGFLFNWFLFLDLLCPLLLLRCFNLRFLFNLRFFSWFLGTFLRSEISFMFRLGIWLSEKSLSRLFFPFIFRRYRFLPLFLLFLW